MQVAQERYAERGPGEPRKRRGICFRPQRHHEHQAAVNSKDAQSGHVLQVQKSEKRHIFAVIGDHRRAELLWDWSHWRHFSVLSEVNRIGGVLRQQSDMHRVLGVQLSLNDWRQCLREDLALPQEMEIFTSVRRLRFPVRVRVSVSSYSGTRN